MAFIYGYGNSYFPKKCNFCPETVRNRGVLSLYFNALIVLPFSNKRILDDTRLAAAPVSITPFVCMSKIKIGIRIYCGSAGSLGWVRLLIDNIELITKISHTSCNRRSDCREPYSSNFLWQYVLFFSKYSK